MSLSGSTEFPRADVGGFSFVDLLLAEQRELTAVERFSQLHSNHEPPPRGRSYAALLPARGPREGEQYSFEVDLDCCSGCKACVTACHSLNGLDEDEAWREVGLLHGGTSELPIVQHVTAACHHCVEPACLSACPVNAYEKDSRTGIVNHLDDQCFGCQYCILACPYDVPKYNPRRGIVRKCDMCSQRLAVDEPPACVQACPHQAIRIRIVNTSDVIDDCESNAFLPGAPNPQLTLPTTNYKSARPLPRNTLPADYYAVRPSHSHSALVMMLVLTQLSVGAFLVELLLRSRTDFRVELQFGWGSVLSISALVCGLLALTASTCHLGRPLYAYRAVLGLTHSWLSREILAFGVFAGLASLYAGTTWLWPEPEGRAGSLHAALGAGVVVSGLAGVFCSVMIYHVTRRPFWHGTRSGARFFLTTFLLGASAVLVTSLLAAAFSDYLTARGVLASYRAALCRWLMIASAAKLAFEALDFVHLRERNTTPLKRSAQLLVGELWGITFARFALGALGGLALPALLLRALAAPAGTGFGDGFLAALVLALFATSLAGELLERHLFFTASVAPRMPGGLT